MSVSHEGGEKKWQEMKSEFCEETEHRWCDEDVKVEWLWELCK